MYLAAADATQDLEFLRCDFPRLNKYVVLHCKPLSCKMGRPEDRPKFPKRDCPQLSGRREQCRPKGLPSGRYRLAVLRLSIPYSGPKHRDSRSYLPLPTLLEPAEA